ncbi:NAD-dependent epimerase/dehydratase family protein [Allonocardiopsis opalescens]|uniref:NAD-dependent epimerase/dehydratase family protein n=1 Tax=Allonocardiopsis opalescens TaxID=1144618 RepID=A0A2T0QAE9_9ACTN|nr:NAD(P)-dependent oxidoreductase [Allonocardiopsis opalescens]PRY00849.1 NAD-dependent epimerase/dehydratase family protein [Allonocardiopsis opalescens]
MTARLLITGASGIVGTLLRPRLARPDRVLRLLDTEPPPPAAEGERVETVTADVTDAAAMAAAMDGVGAVLHLAGLSGEDAWERILSVNIDGTQKVLEAARLAGVRRVVLASSNHAVGFHPRAAGEAGDYLFPRPDGFYGVGKAALEALGSLYHDRYGLDVIALRIGSCFERPSDVRMLATWLSPDDCARLVEACLSAPDPGFRVAWGVSDNTRRWWSLEEARALGYEPRDDAERYAAEVAAAAGEPGPGEPAAAYVGGVQAWRTAGPEDPARR